MFDPRVPQFAEETNAHSLASLELAVLMRNLARLAALAAIPLLAGCALKHAHVASGRSLLPYQGHPLHPAVEFRVGYTLEQFPRWAGAFSFSHSSPPFDTATYIEPKCGNTGCRPAIVHDWSALEVQYRWSPAHPVHPLASVALGRINTGYFWPRQSDSTEASTFLALGGGGELTIARWLHVSVVTGYRQSFRKTIPNRTVSNSGFSITSLLLVGRPYRDR